MAHTKTIIGIILLLLLSACHETGTKQNLQNLDDVLTKFNELDGKYGTEWKKERLDVNMIKIENIEPYKTDIEEFKKQINEKLMIDLVDTRILMLETQKEFLTAKTIDPRPLAEFYFGIVNGTMTQIINVTGLSCQNKTNVFNAMPYYEKTGNKLKEFITKMDSILERSAEAREKIGTGKREKMDFYRFAPVKLFTANKISKNAIMASCK